MSNELNPNGDEIVKIPLNQDEDSEDEDLEFLSGIPNAKPEDSEDEAGKASLEAYNAEMRKRGFNYNFKSWDDVAKSNKQAAIAFAKNGMENQPVDPTVTPKPEDVTPVAPVAPVAPAPEQVPSNLSERLLKVEHPESVFIIDEIKRDHPGKDPLTVYETSSYYQKEAVVRAETERNKQRISNPSGNTEGQPEVNETEDKFIGNLPASFAVKKQ
jgi:hypothetical protein